MSRARAMYRAKAGVGMIAGAVVIGALAVPLQTGAAARSPRPTHSETTYTANGVSATLTTTIAGTRYVSLALKPSKCVRQGARVSPPPMQVGRAGRFSYKGRVRGGRGGTATISGRVPSATNVTVKATYRAGGCVWRLNTTATRHATAKPSPACSGERTAAWVTSDGTPHPTGFGNPKPAGARLMCWPPASFAGTLAVASVSAIPDIARADNAKGEVTFVLRRSNGLGPVGGALYAAEPIAGSWEVSGQERYNVGSEQSEKTCRTTGGDKLRSAANFKTEGFGFPSMALHLQPGPKYAFYVEPRGVEVTSVCTYRGGLTFTNTEEYFLGSLAPQYIQPSAYGLDIAGTRTEDDAGSRRGWNRTYTWNLHAPE